MASLSVKVIDLLTLALGSVTDGTQATSHLFSVGSWRRFTQTQSSLTLASLKQGGHRSPTRGCSDGWLHSDFDLHRDCPPNRCISLDAPIMQGMLVSDKFEENFFKLGISSNAEVSVDRRTLANQIRSTEWRLPETAGDMGTSKQTRHYTQCPVFDKSVPPPNPVQMSPALLHSPPGSHSPFSFVRHFANQRRRGGYSVRWPGGRRHRPGNPHPHTGHYPYGY